MEVSPPLFPVGDSPERTPPREIPTDLLTTIPPKIARDNRIVPWEKREDGRFILVSDDPMNILASDYFKKIMGGQDMKDVEVIITFPAEMDQLLDKYYGRETMEDLSQMLQEASSATIDLDLPVADVEGRTMKPLHYRRRLLRYATLSLLRH